MQKINFEDLPSTNTPVNATNLNAMQSNVEGAMKNALTTSTTDTYCCNYINGIVESGSNANGYYTKFADGTLINRYYVGPVTINGGSGASVSVTFPFPFIDTNWYSSIVITNGQNYWSWLATAVKDIANTGFSLDIWNNSNGQCPNQYFNYIAIGRWK